MIIKKWIKINKFIFRRIVPKYQVSIIFHQLTILNAREIHIFNNLKKPIRKIIWPSLIIIFSIEYD